MIALTKDNKTITIGDIVEYLTPGFNAETYKPIPISSNDNSIGSITGRMLYARGTVKRIYDGIDNFPGLGNLIELQSGVRLYSKDVVKSIF